jgi:putative heme iron utilization protein
VLAKKIKEAQQKDQQHPERKFENKSEVISSWSFFTAGVSRADIVFKSSQSFFDGAVLKGYCNTVFHPPGNA